MSPITSFLRASTLNSARIDYLIDTLVVEALEELFDRFRLR